MYRGGGRFQGGYRGGYSKGYQNKNYKTGLAEFKNHTEQTRKHFLSNYLLQWVDNPTRPDQGYILTDSGARVGCFVLCKLPYDCLAVFVDNKVMIAERVNRDGSLTLMKGVYYSLDSTERMWADRLGVSMWESQFVQMVIDLIRMYYSN